MCHLSLSSAVASIGDLGISFPCVFPTEAPLQTGEGKTSEAGQQRKQDLVKNRRCDISSRFQFSSS